MPEGRRGKRKNGEPRTMCQHYSVTRDYDATGGYYKSCEDCGKSLGYVDNRSGRD